MLHAALAGVAPELLDPVETFDNERVTLSPDAAAAGLGPALEEAVSRYGADLAGVHPAVSRRAVGGLKFADLLPPTWPRPPSPPGSPTMRRPDTSSTAAPSAAVS